MVGAGLTLPHGAQYAYEPGDRRDPFVKGGALTSYTRCRCGGLGGFLIEELALRGLVRARNRMLAMLEGPDGKTYFVNVGDRLYDGDILAIDARGIVFRQEVLDPLAPAK